MDETVTKSDGTLAELRVARLARRATWSIFLGLAGCFLMLIDVWPQLALNIGVMPPLFWRVLQEAGTSVLRWSFWVGALVAVLLGYAAICLGVLGGKRDNDYNRSLAFWGIGLGAVAVLGAGGFWAAMGFFYSDDLFLIAVGAVFVGGVCARLVVRYVE